MDDTAEGAGGAQQSDRARAVFGLFLAATAALFLWDAHSLSSEYTKGVGPAAIPVVMGLCLLVLSLLYLAPVLLRGVRDGRSAELHGRPSSRARPSLRSSPLTYMVLSLLFLLSIDLMGFFVALSLFLLVTCSIAGVRPWWKGVLIVIAMDLFCYFGFTVGLGIYFPTGWFV